MSENEQNQTTHFGYETVATSEKADKVADVFHSVASKYDVMNDVMSFGLHRLWKRYTLAQSKLKPGHQVLDIAGGTGDLTKLFSKAVGPTGKVYLADINASMLQEGRDRLIDQNQAGNVEFVQADAERLPFADKILDRVCIGFGLRNVTDKEAALRSMYRVLKPGGKLLILEFSQPPSPLLKKVYDQYSFKVIPKAGKLITKDEASYQYLVESIRMHPDQETLLGMMQTAGFEDAGYHNLAGGIVALHYGYKY